MWVSEWVSETKCVPGSDADLVGLMLQGPAHGHLNQSKEFMADARLALLQQMGATPFNLVVSDYGWWTTMSMTRPGERNRRKTAIWLA